jgi:hypothetical protein
MPTAPPRRFTAPSTLVVVVGIDRTRRVGRIQRERARAQKKTKKTRIRAPQFAPRVAARAASAPRARASARRPSPRPRDVYDS